MKRSRLKRGAGTAKKKRMMTLSNKDWTVVATDGDLNIYKGKSDIMSWVGVLAEQEEDWQPATIQVSKDDLKEIDESNVSIFMGKRDVEKKKWKNTAVARGLGE